MADAYSYAALVELEENNIPRLKNKLVKYFQSKKSRGGDCEVEYEDGSRTAVVRFRREEDQQNVLGKEAHQIGLDKGVVKMTVRSLTEETTTQEAPSDKLNKDADVAVNNKQSSINESTPVGEVQIETRDRDDETADEELCSTSAVLGNIPETLNQEFLEMLVENILKDSDSPSDTQSFTVEVIPDISSAVVTFQSAKENTDFVTRCPQNRTFTKKGLSVRPLDITEQVVVEDIQNFSEDLLRLYFENVGVDVENFALNEAQQSAIITFKDHKAVKKIMKKKHHIMQEEIRVYPFYKSLGTALYGKDKPSLKLPASVSESIDYAIWRYLKDNQSAAETIHSQLAKDFCNINLNQSNVCFSPTSSLLQQKDAEVIIKEWRDTVKSTFAQALSKFKSLKLKPESEVWEESEEKIRLTLLNEDVVVVPDKANGVLSVVGLVDDVNRLEQTLCEVLNKIAKKVQREKWSRTQEIKVSPSIFHILCEDGLQDKLLDVYPELKMSFTKESPNLIVTGLGEEILAASKVIYDATFELERQDLEIDNFVLDLLKNEQQEELTYALLISTGINASFQVSAHRVQLLAASERELNEAKDHLRRMLISQYTDVEDSSVLGKPEWQDLVTQLENANNKPCMKIGINITGQQVVVSGHKDSVIRVSSELGDFLTQNAQVEETVVVKSSAIVKYIEKLDTCWLEQVKDKVVLSYKKEAICLSGSRVDVAECKTLVENLVSSVFFDCLKVSMPGVKKFFQDKEAMYVSSVSIQTGCMVQLVDEGSGGQDDLVNRQVPKPAYYLQTSDGVEIAVCKADMCSYPVHAVVSAANQALKHNGGLAAALLNAAGPQLQDECDKLINLNGQLKPGDCVITGAGGQLCCKKVIHAVGPKFDPLNSLQALALLNKTIKGSLELAEKHGCVSVAIPAISRNLGFSLNVCAVTIIKAVKEHCKEHGNINLKRIHLVNNDDKTVQAMEAAVRQEFGDHGVSLSQQTATTKPTNAPLVKRAESAGSDPKSLGQAQTKEDSGIIVKKEECKVPLDSFSKVVSSSGMHETKMGGVVIQVVTGDITKETTEVIVNSSNEKFTLKSGVSRAILNAAGKAVEAECHKLGAQPNPGMILSQPGNLKCKKILHLVGQTDPMEIKKVVQAALEMCVKNSYTSVSFPAIGTGQGNVSVRLVADAMLDAVIDVMSQNASGSLKTIRIVVFKSFLLKEFYNSMQQKEATEPKKAAEPKKATEPKEATEQKETTEPKDKGDASNVKSFSNSEITKKPQKERDFVIEALHLDPASFHICGESQAKVDAAKRWINDLISDEQHSLCISDDTILSFCDAELQRIVGIQKTMGVAITIESMKGHASITIEGLTKDVLKASNEIHEMLRAEWDEDELRMKIELASTVAEWQYQQQGLEFQSFDSMANFKLEQALEKKLPKVRVKVQGQEYTVTLPDGPATDNRGRILQIKRIDKIQDKETPDHWDAMPPDTSCHAVTLNAGTTEHTEVLDLFLASCKRTVLKIERIQNPVLWESLQIKKRDMEQRNDHQNNEKRLFHGTCHNTVAHINEHGFNRSYAGKNAAMYGNGTYFAVNASYSAHNTYSKPNKNGEKCMYLCRVLTGDFTAGRKHMITPPAKSTDSIQKYDSVVDNVAKPSMFIIFHDSQAYPEYLITFK